MYILPGRKTDNDKNKKEQKTDHWLWCLDNNKPINAASMSAPNSVHVDG